MKPTRVARRKTGAKAVTFAPAGVSWTFALPGTHFNYAKEVGDGLKSSVIVPLLCWLMRAVPEAPVMTERFEDDQWTVDPKHPLTRLLRRPNPFYSRRVLLQATTMDYSFGEAFWIKNRDGFGKLAELYWAPRALLTPKLREPGRIESLYYEYAVNGQRRELPAADVVHFRFGCDPQNPLRGFSPLAAMFREVYVDDQAANFTASILRNLGIIGLIFSPKTGAPAIPSTKLTELKDYVQQNLTGDHRGKAMAFSSGIDAQVLAYNLQGFDVGPIRDISEERLSAATGIPAAIVGFGTGLQTTKVGATYREMRQLAWRQAVIPMQQDFSEELDRSLLPEFQDNLNLFQVSFDSSAVFDLWEDKKDRHQRVRDDFAGHMIDWAEARRELGYPVREEHKDRWAQPSTMTLTDGDGNPIGPAGQAAPGTAPPPSPPDPTLQLEPDDAAA